MSELRTPREWEVYYDMGTIVYDPDGWRYSHRGLSPKSFGEPIPFEEYEIRKWPSTIGPRYSKLGGDKLAHVTVRMWGDA